MPWARDPPGPDGRAARPRRRRTSPTPPGPRRSRPTIVLLHALGCTGLLTWFPAIEPLSRRFRVVTLDLRWHGRGIQQRGVLARRLRRRRGCAPRRARPRRGDRRRLLDGLDRGAAGLAPAPGDRVRGLVLCATTDRFQMSARRSARSSPGWAPTMLGAAQRLPLAHRGARRPRGRPAPLDLEPTRHPGVGARASSVRTSPWAVGQALAALGRHHSRPWLGRIDVPTAVVVTRQRPRDPARAPARAGPRHPRRDHRTTSTPATRRARWRPRCSCRPSSRPSPPSTRGAATSARASPRTRQADVAQSPNPTVSGAHTRVPGSLAGCRRGRCLVRARRERSPARSTTTGRGKSASVARPEGDSARLGPV